ncbi:MAG: hypothetical protein RL459_498 [Pseudomonadota bacterium]|jgi:dihydropteroate synthase
MITPMTSSIWQTSRFQIDLSKPRVMGIVNVTPDSFSDGGQNAGIRAALEHCERLISEGADILDIGGESTRPGAIPVPQEQELARVLPVLAEAVKLGVPISVDTYKPAVMRAVLDLGADIINDIWALRWQTPGDGAGSEPSAQEVVAAHPRCGVVLMHMQGEPRSMQIHPMQGDVLPAVASFLEHAAQSLCHAGVQAERIALDPGIGFGKTVQQNFSLLARQAELLTLGYPLLAGWSRKSSLAAVAVKALSDLATLDVQARRVPSVVAATLAVERGARVVRVHDVLQTVQALQVLQAMNASTISAV